MSDVAPDEVGALLDQLNVELELTEDYIASLNIGETAEVPYESGDGLVFMKRGDHWGMYVRSGGDVVPLTTTSKRLRIEAVALVPRLIEALREMRATRTVQLKVAIDSLRKIRVDKS